MSPAEDRPLQERLDAALAEIERLRAEAAARQADIRALAAQLPERLSRRAVLTNMFSGAFSGLRSGVGSGVGSAMRRLRRRAS